MYWHSYITEADIPYEEDLLRNPFQLKAWLRYIEHEKRNGASLKKITFLYERSLLELPGSYKLWKEHLDHLGSNIVACSSCPWKYISIIYERALLFLPRMPKIWHNYASILMTMALKYPDKRHIINGKIFKVLNRALQSLPVAQHEQLWNLYLPYIKGLHETSQRRAILAVYARHLQFNPSYINTLVQEWKYNAHFSGELAVLYVILLSPQMFPQYPASSKSASELWKDFITLLSHCQLPFLSMVESIKEFSVMVRASEIASFFNTWADMEHYFFQHGAKPALAKTDYGWVCACWATILIRNRQYERSRNVLYDALENAVQVRDFGQIFDALAIFEESQAKRWMQDVRSKDALWKADFHLVSLEVLMKDRPILLSDILLKQNPNNVEEWIKRVALYKNMESGGKEEMIVHTFTTAVRTVDPAKTMHLSKLWIEFARFYESQPTDSSDSVAAIFEKAILVPYKHVQDLVDVWVEYASWAERRRGVSSSIELLMRAVKVPSKQHVKRLSDIRYSDDDQPAHIRIVKSIKLWNKIIELEKMVPDNGARIRAAYDRTIELSITTPQLLHSYAAWLEENQYHEDSFKIYERGIDLFGYPVAFEFWNVYLAKITERYGASKIERIRALFERALEDIPIGMARDMYIMYGLYEEKHGLSGNAIKIYDRAVSATDQRGKDGEQLFSFYISKSMEYFGIPSTRPIFEAAIQKLEPQMAKNMCLKYAALEEKIGEISRARAIYIHGGQYCDPRTVPQYWSVWQDFEIKHGNEDTFREMLRTKRSVQARFPDEISFVSAAGIVSQAGESQSDGII